MLTLAVDIGALYASGLTLVAIGRAAGISAEAVRKRLRAAGIARRHKAAHLMTDRNPTRGKGHTEATKAKIRAANLRQFSDPAARQRAAHNQRAAMSAGRSIATSKIEETVARQLDALGIAYTRQYAVRHPRTGRYCACLDFMLADGRAIEVNGTYWHADPRAYPTGPIHASQKRTAMQYAAKITALAELGIPLIEIWEIDLRADPARAVRMAVR